MKVYTPAQMRAADKYTIENLKVPGTVLMERAAKALFDVLRDESGKGKRFVILCGKGNNGGDGWALALMLSEIFEKVTCLSVFGGSPSTAYALHFYTLCSEKGIYTVDCTEKLSDASEEINKADVIVDAIFGTGFSGNIESDSICAKLVQIANNSRAIKLAADIPSGANALDGGLSEIHFNADITVTFAGGKVGMYSYPARKSCGKIVIADIWLPDEAFPKTEYEYEISDDGTIVKYMPRRYIDSNKGSYGKVLIVAGSENMTGAAHLACLGALRMGAGLICLASEKSVIDTVKCRLSEPIYMPVTDSEEDTEKLTEYTKTCSAVLIGCGLGRGEKVKKRVIGLIKNSYAPIILDADGINVISDNINVLSEAKSDIILTPHPLEFSRISGLSVSEIQNNRISCAEQFSKKYGCTLLLKGAGTVISEKGVRLCVNTVGNSALSKGGSGDVLSGMIASVAAQGASTYESAVCAAYLHGKSGEMLAKEYSEYGVLMSDIPEAAARLLSKILK